MAEKSQTKATAAMADDKKRAIETAMQQIERTYGKGSIMRFGDNTVSNVEAISTGSLALDLALEKSPAVTPLTSEQYNWLYDNYMPATVSNGTYEDNLKLLGDVDLASPKTINIYASTFADKDAISDAIEQYNNSVSEDDQIDYTDYVALLMSSVTTIINAISYVLIGFVAISLVVSSIMIGIITYISVLERTKEIGILRAMGASKHNVSQVCNAETGIIGLCSGLLGVGLTVLLNIPINAVLRHFIGNADVNAALPVTGGVVLVILSVVLTLIGGLIPSRKAAKQDPATAPSKRIDIVRDEIHKPRNTGIPAAKRCSAASPASTLGWASRYSRQRGRGQRWTTGEIPAIKTAHSVKERCL